MIKIRVSFIHHFEFNMDHNNRVKKKIKTTLQPQEEAESTARSWKVWVRDGLQVRSKKKFVLQIKTKDNDVFAKSAMLARNETCK